MIPSHDIRLSDDSLQGGLGKGIQKEQMILHAGFNNFYVSVETMPKGHPVAVGGSAKNLHGIILAKIHEAKNSAFSQVNPYGRPGKIQGSHYRPLLTIRNCSNTPGWYSKSIKNTPI